MCVCVCVCVCEREDRGHQSHIPLPSPDGIAGLAAERAGPNVLRGVELSRQLVEHDGGGGEGG